MYLKRIVLFLAAAVLLGGCAPSFKSYGHQSWRPVDNGTSSAQRPEQGKKASPELARRAKKASSLPNKAGLQVIVFEDEDWLGVDESLVAVRETDKHGNVVRSEYFFRGKNGFLKHAAGGIAQGLGLGFGLSNIDGNNATVRNNNRMWQDQDQNQNQGQDQGQNVKIK